MLGEFDSDSESSDKLPVCEVCTIAFIPEHDWETRKDNLKPFLCSACNKSSEINQIYVQQDDSMKEPKRFICGTCYQAFPSRKELSWHKTMTHSTGSKPFYCETCKKTFKRETNLNNHLRSHKKEKDPYICYISPATSTNEVNNDKKMAVFQDSNSESENLDVDDPEYLNTDSFICSVCAKSFDSEEMFLKHTCVEVHTCYLCNESFSTKRELILHQGSCYKNVNDDDQFVCNICGKIFQTKISLDHHINIHISPKTQNVCVVCSASFEDTNELSIHLDTHIEKQPFICDICFLSFTQEQDLYSHKLTHINEDISDSSTCSMNDTASNNPDSPDFDPLENQLLFICKTCQETFATRSELITHMQSSHSSEETLICSICSEEFDNKMNLSAHISTHADEPLYICDICCVCFSSKHNLAKHQLVHTNIKPYTCKLCKRSFRESNHLRRHIRTHTGEKPFICEICFEAFRLENQLKMHNISCHSGKAPYSCQICEKPFLYKCRLKTHLRLHTHQKRYSCKYCRKSFWDSSLLENHDCSVNEKNWVNSVMSLIKSS